MREILIKQTGKQLIRTSRCDIHILFTLLERHEAGKKNFYTLFTSGFFSFLFELQRYNTGYPSDKMKHSPRFLIVRRDRIVSRKCLSD